MAHGLIEVDGGKSALAPLREALFRVGQEIAQKMSVAPTPSKLENGDTLH